MAVFAIALSSSHLPMYHTNRFLLARKRAGGSLVRSSAAVPGSIPGLARPYSSAQTNWARMAGRGLRKKGSICGINLQVTWSIEKDSLCNAENLTCCMIIGGDFLISRCLLTGVQIDDILREWLSMIC
jgi:hypothetical protein